MLFSLGGKGVVRRGFGGLCGALLISAVLVPAGADAGKRKRPVLTPKVGAKYVAGERVNLTVKAHRHDDVRALLNGVDVGGEIEQNRGKRRRRVQLSRSHGLRYGRNKVRVTVNRFHGGRKVRTVWFRVRGRKPLVGAGRDRALAPKARIQLRSESLARRGAGPLRHGWRVVGAGRRAATLSDRRSATPTFAARRPGTYKLRARVRTEDGAVGTDRLRLRVDPPPALELDTMAQDDDGNWGIRVGEKVYPAEQGAWLQVLAIDGSDGTKKWNRSYPCPDTTPRTIVICISDVKRDIKELKQDALVIASNQPEGGGTGAAPVDAALALKALKPATQHFPVKNPPDLVRGTYSALGVVGGPSTAHSAPVNEPGAGRIEGLLIRNNNLDYGFVGTEEIDFDTQAEGSSDTRSVISVGAKSYAAEVGDSKGGFHVVTVDNRDPSSGSSSWFDTGGKRGSAAMGEVRRLHSTLAAAVRGGKLVFLSTIGRPALAADAYEDLDRGALYEAIRALASRIQSVGGTRGEFFRQIDAGLSGGRTSYTLVGQGAETGAGIGEQSFGKDMSEGEPNASPLAGELTRSSFDYSFQVGRVFGHEPLKPVGKDVGELLVETVYSKPTTPWPGSGDSGRQSAIAWIGKQAGLGDDPRTAYYTRPYTAESWARTRRTITALDASGLPEGIEAADFEWARQQLLREIDWLEQTYSFVRTLATPYAKNAVSSWADLTAAAAKVNSEVKVPPDDQVGMAVGTVFDLAREGAENIPEIGEGLMVANKLYDGVLEVIDYFADPDQDPAGEFEVKVAEAGQKLANRLQDAQDTLTTSFARVLVADYGKLRTVGTCSAGGAECAAGWQVTNDDLVRMGQALRASLRGTFYAALLPARFDLWAIALSSNVPDASKYWGKSPFATFPFKGIPEGGQFSAPFCRDLGDSKRDAWHTYALGHRTGAGIVTEPWKMEVPKAGLVDPLFEDIDKARFPEGPLGLDKETFYRENFPLRTMEHFPLRDSEMHWNDKTTAFRRCDE